jgi:hypothetical protein
LVPAVRRTTPGSLRRSSGSRVRSEAPCRSARDSSRGAAVQLPRVHAASERLHDRPTLSTSFTQSVLPAGGGAARADRHPAGTAGTRGS